MAIPQLPEYVTFVGASTVVGPDMYVGWGYKADGNTKVHSPGFAEWEEVTDPGLVKSIKAAAESSSLQEVRLENIRATSTESANQIVSNRIWAGIVNSRAINANQITGDMIKAGSITAESGIIQSLDAGKITSGTLSSDRIAARSITAAKLAAGTITADSGVIGSLDAGSIRSGFIDAARINVDTLRGKTLTAGTVTGSVITGTNINGGTITGSTVRTSSGADRTEMSTENGLRVISGSKVVAQMDASYSTGLALRNPNTGNLTEVSSVVFGASYWSGGSVLASDGNGYKHWDITVPALPTTRAMTLFTYEIRASGGTTHIAQMWQSSINYAGPFEDFDQSYYGGLYTIFGICTSMNTTGTTTLRLRTFVGTGRTTGNNSYSINNPKLLLIPC